MILNTKPILTSQKERSVIETYCFALKFALLVPFVHLYMKIFGFNHTLSLLKKFVPKDSTPTPIEGKVKFSASIVRRIARRVREHSPLPGTCLSRSLALWLQLQRMGIETELYIGIDPRNQSKKFEAHAWIEYAGQALNAGRFVRQRYVAFEKSAI